MKEIGTNVSGVTLNSEGGDILTKSAENLLSYFRTLPKGEPITATQNELAKTLNCNRRTIIRSLEQLEEAGKIRIESGKTEGAQNTYFLNKEKPAEIVHVTAKKPESSFYLLDKVTQKTFEITKSGHYSIGVENKKDKKAGKEINVFLEIDFSEIENNPAFKISKPLNMYDKRIYNIICSLWKAGNHCITLAQIYRELERKTGMPAKSQAEKIRESSEKMAKIVIEIDNYEEAAVYRGYPHFQSGRINLLPSESITDRSIEINGQILDYCLYLYREPPLLTYAEAHKQITALTPEQATLPDGLSTTEDNLILDDYLKYRIARHKAYGTKILYKTIYETCKIDNKLKRSRATKKIRKLLTHYKQTGMIKSYQERKDGITFAPCIALE